ncbi:protein-tyrosine phosphatase [Atractiella rhizophila]|nr:protein-tyrosine phosphatase [Atractiella rhizophila]
MLEEPFVPPENFGVVEDGIFRSGFPRHQNFAYLKSLGLRTIVSFTLEEYPAENLRFIREEGINFYQFGIAGVKEPTEQIPKHKIDAALSLVLDRRNHPILIHCNKGKHRTGVLVGCLRKLMDWDLSTILEEYSRYASPKERLVDQLFIQDYSTDAVCGYCRLLTSV